MTSRRGERLHLSQPDVLPGLHGYTRTALERAECT